MRDSALSCRQYSAE